MSIEGVIREEAQKIAAELKGRAPELQEEYLEAKARADNLKAQFDAANVALERVADFKPNIEGLYQCPSCWVKQNQQASMIRRQIENKDDSFRCSRCGHITKI